MFFSYDGPCWLLKALWPGFLHNFGEDHSGSKNGVAHIMNLEDGEGRINILQDINAFTHIYLLFPWIISLDLKKIEINTKNKKVSVQTSSLLTSLSPPEGVSHHGPYIYCTLQPVLLELVWNMGGMHHLWAYPTTRIWNIWGQGSHVSMSVFLVSRTLLIPYSILFQNLHRLLIYIW